MYSSAQRACAILEACRDSFCIRTPTGFPGLSLGPLQDKAENASKLLAVKPARPLMYRV